MSDGYGPSTLNPLVLALRDRRLDDVDLLATEIAAIAGMRIETRDRDARIFKTGGAQRGIGKLEGAQDALFGDVARDFGERDMRGHPRIP